MMRARARHSGWVITCICPCINPCTRASVCVFASTHVHSSSRPGASCAIGHANAWCHTDKRYPTNELPATDTDRLRIRMRMRTHPKYPSFARKNDTSFGSSKWRNIDGACLVSARLHSRNSRLLRSAFERTPPRARVKQCSGDTTSSPSLTSGMSGRYAGTWVSSSIHRTGTHARRSFGWANQSPVVLLVRGNNLTFAVW